ncbi:MAG: DUF167 domain-containing protein [Candidatus Harrisonbacteria bacterium]|nr:DUF167 domain-containing protein [Candidatus Harrisonbacteria bacterium]
MKIFVHAKPKSRKEFVERVDDTHLIVAVKDPPVNNRANLAIIDALAEYFGVAPSRVSIVGGQTSKEKVVEIAGL